MMAGAPFIDLRRLDELLAALGLSPVGTHKGLTLTSAPAAGEQSPQPVAVPQPAASGAPGFTLPATPPLQSVRLPAPAPLNLNDGRKNAGLISALSAGQHGGAKGARNRGR